MKTRKMGGVDEDGVEMRVGDSRNLVFEQMLKKCMYVILKMLQ